MYTTRRVMGLNNPSALMDQQQHWSMKATNMQILTNLVLSHERKKQVFNMQHAMLRYILMLQVVIADVG